MLLNSFAGFPKAIFGDNVQYRINYENYPYTYDSLEIEVMYEGKRLEVVGAGIVNPKVLENLGIDSQQYNGWAFGF
jgi:phenylalanyl-tRNA synthetase alpha chain